MQKAFYSCTALEVLEFKGEGTTPLTIEADAFYNTYNLTAIILPARLAEMNLQMFNIFTKLTSLEVEAGGTHYSSLNNMICNASGDTILYTLLSISGEFEIPIGIREVGAAAFASHKYLTKVIIPSYVNKIGASAFQNATGITEVIVEGSRNNDLLIDTSAFAGCVEMDILTFQGNDSGKTDVGAITLGSSAFAGNKKLHDIVYENGSNVTAIGARTFADCTMLTEAYIPATTSTVGDSAFAGCEGIANVTFAPNGMSVSFGSNVFAGCKRLTTINLPATISHFEGGVFAGCDAIREVVVDPANENFVAYEDALYTKDYSEILFYPRALDGDLSKLHPELKVIGDNVFQGNPKITKYAVPANITQIGNYAFDGCYNLAEVTFATGFTQLNVGAYAFSNCALLTSVELPSVTTRIGLSAFKGTPLTGFTIPESVTYLGGNALNATKITEIVIPANVETIGDGAFANTPLTTITFAESDKPLALGTVTNGSKTSGVFYGTKITEFSVPNRVTHIGAYAFYNQIYLTKVTMNPDSNVTQIGKYAFAVEDGTSKLADITFGNKLATIGERAFYKTKSLTEVVIPTSVTLVDKYAFSDSLLKTVTFLPEGTQPLELREWAFANSKLTTVTLPARLQLAYEIYTSSNYNAEFKTFYNRFSNNTGLTDIHVESGGHNFGSVDGIVYEMDIEGNPTVLLYCPPAKTGELLIPKEVRWVENAAFVKTKLSKISFEEYSKEDPNYGQQLLEIGNGVTISPYSSSATYAVFSGSSLKEVNFPSHLKRLGVLTFNGLTAAGTKINFNQDAHLQDMGGLNFYGCSGVEELHLPSVDVMLPAVCSNLTKATTITIGKDSKLTEIPKNAFYSCQMLTTIEIPASVTKLGDSAFAYCRALASVTFEEGSQLKETGISVFANSGLVEFVMPDMLTEMREDPFNGCKNLKRVTLSKSMMSPLANGASSIFEECLGLEYISVPKENPYLKSIDGVLYDIAETIVYCYPCAKDPTGFKLPDTLITIEDYAFAYFPGTSIELPESLEVIGTNAFRYCQLTSIHIPKNVREMKKYTFYFFGKKSALETVTFAPDSKLQTLGMGVFHTCNALKELSLPRSEEHTSELQSPQ